MSDEPIHVPYELREFFNAYHQPEVCAVLFGEDEVASRQRDPVGLKNSIEKAYDAGQIKRMVDLATICVMHNCTYRQGLIELMACKEANPQYL